MEGKVFLYNQIPPPQPAFTFDLQRFATWTLVKEGSNYKLTSGDTIKEDTTLTKVLSSVEVADNDTIQLLEDITTISPIEITKTLTIDLNGKTISRQKSATNPAYDSDAFKVITAANGVQGNLTIEDNAGGGRVIASSEAVNVGYSSSAGTFTLKSGILEATSTTLPAVQVYGGSTAYIEGGTIVTGKKAIKLFSNATADINIKDVTFEGAETAIEADNGSNVTGVSNLFSTYLNNKTIYCTTQAALDTALSSAANLSVTNPDGTVRGFTTLYEAHSYAGEGATIKVLKDYTDGSDNHLVSITKNLTLDLNGRTLTSTSINQLLIINDNVNFTIMDSSSEQTGKITSGGQVQEYGLIYALQGSTVNLVSGTLESTTHSVHALAGSTFKMTGGNIRSDRTAVYTKGGTVDVSGTAYIEGTTGIEVVHGSRITMSGGEIKSVGNENDTAVQIGSKSATYVENKETKDYIDKNDSFTMNGGKLSGNCGVALYNGGASFTMNDGKIDTTSFAVTNNDASNQDNTININGGTLTSSGAPAIYHAGLGTTTVTNGTITGTTGIECRAGTLNVTGGVFSTDVSAYVAESVSKGYLKYDGKQSFYVGENYEEVTSKPSVTVDGETVYYSTEEKFEGAIKAQIGNNYYTTFDKAYNAAQAGDTIKLLGNDTVTTTTTIGENITIDLNGKTLTASNGFSSSKELNREKQRQSARTLPLI